jgi:translation elongation factor EF-4
MMDILKQRRAVDVIAEHLEGEQMSIQALVPWAEVVCDMNDSVKNLSSGYASFNYEEAGYSTADLVKVEIAINGEACDPLSFITHTSKASTQGRTMATV